MVDATAFVQTAEREGRGAHIHPGTLAAAAAVRDRLGALVEERLQAGAEPDPFRGLHLDPADAARLLARASAASDPSTAAEVPYLAPRGVAGSPLDRASAALHLHPFETAVLALCLLPEIDAACGSLIGFLHDDVTRKQPSVELALALFAPPGAAGLDDLRFFAPTAALRRWQMIDVPREEALARQPLRLDSAVLWFLLGEEALDPDVADVAYLRAHTSREGRAGAPSLEALLGTAGAPLLLYGDDEPACVDAVEGAGRPVLLIDGARLAAHEAGPDLLRRCLRAALFRDLLPCVRGAAALLQQDSARAERVRQCVLECPPPLVLTCRSNDGEIPYAGSGVLPLHVPPPDAATRLALWRAEAAARDVAVDERALLALSETSRLSGAAIAEAFAVAQDAAQAGGEAAEGRHVQSAARGAARVYAPSLTITAPRFGWEDIVLPPDRLQSLHHLCGRLRHRSRVAQEWGVGRHALPGVTALFVGEPGTGKSMATEVIAADLGLDLCRIDLAQVVSKYIGETEKNLARIFDEAEQCGVALVFDEADALFGKRSDVRDSHDRYANIEVSYLLQRMERYRGLAVLTTNLRGNLDDAFTRRIAVIVDFPRPGPADRLRIWRRALAAAPCDPALDLEELAQRLDLAGGAIVNVAVAAAHLAAAEHGAIDCERLLRAVRWELQKMGRLLGSDALPILEPATAGAGRNGHQIPG